uniref:Uncharacterized protein n=1 Tax=Anguilla anguilla TaxID=7936 RepID=A0A0E9VSY9_ANGAN
MKAQYSQTQPVTSDVIGSADTSILYVFLLQAPFTQLGNMAEKLKTTSEFKCRGRLTTD